MSDVLTINEDLFIGSGGHQATYIHPTDNAKCIKVPHVKDDGDVRKEMRYRRACATKLEQSKLITKFYGTVDTNIGTGYIFERVLNYNGKTSLDMEKFLPKSCGDSELRAKMQDVLMNFKEEFLSENIVIVDTDITNFMVQEYEPNKYRVRIVDNIGTPVLIPLVYWFDFAASWKAKHYWNKIVTWLAENYGDIVTTDFAAKLSA
ncbi:MAG: hypothetical protein K6G55_01185 [Selenomonadaceae bacterium]|nr:hypothetical protein [Selenomonadaceae bacterium]